MATEENAEPDLRSYLRVLRGRLGWVVGTVVLCALLAGAYSATQKKQYSSSAQLLVQPATGTVSLGGASPSISPTNVSTELQLITSEPVKAQVKKVLGAEPNVSATQVGLTDVISVTATASTPAAAAKIANAYATAFVSYERTTTIDNLTAVEQQLQRQITSIDAQMAALQKPSSSTSSSSSTSPPSTPAFSALLSQQTALKEQLAQLQVSGATATGGLEVVTPAVAPSAPSSPKPARDVLIAVVVGLILGVGIAFLVDSLDDRVYTKADVEAAAPGMPLLAEVPRVTSWKKRDQAVLVTSGEHSSLVTEAYRTLRTSLQFVGADRALRTVLVTSPSVGDGKTSTAANLGVVLARAGQRVVVVDCDLRRPRLGSFLHRSEDVGLTSVLVGKASLAEAQQPVEGIENLTMLGSGPRPPNPAELLGSGGFGDILGQLRQQFDLVVVDSPPLLAVTDALVLARGADMTLLVVAAGDTKKHQVSQAADRLAQADITHVGLVLNEVRSGAKYGYSYGGYGYGAYVAAPASTNGHSAVASNGRAPAHARQQRT